MEQQDCTPEDDYFLGHVDVMQMTLALEPKQGEVTRERAKRAANMVVGAWLASIGMDAFNVGYLSTLGALSQPAQEAIDRWVDAIKEVQGR